tara:strand:- start:14188 stop:14997 length:810 start_codon:yes stop_codon:yes gene_type:complete
MQIRYSNLPSFFALLLWLGFVASPVTADDTNREGRLYPASVNPVADVEQALGRAEDNDRLLLVVAGANWCHDSRALASRLYESPLSDLVQDKYELVFVNVGFYEQGRDVMQRFGVPHYYATPTVLIVDPASEQVINDEDRHQWGNAYNIDMPASVEYFEKWLNHDAAAEPGVESAQLRSLNLKIDEFEQQLADRLVAGYAVVGPLLEATEAGNRSEEFKASWNELRKFRSAIPTAVHELRVEARQRVAAGEENIELAFPDHALLSWELR